MCGRFVVFSNLETLVAHFGVDRAETPVTASCNVAPSQPVAAVVRQGEQHLLVHLRWALVPFWAKDGSIDKRLINARAETAADKPSFRAAFRKRHCLAEQQLHRFSAATAPPQFQQAAHQNPQALLLARSQRARGGSIIEEAGERFPVEITSGQTVVGDMPAGLRWRCALSGRPLEAATLVHGGADSCTRGGVAVRPWFGI